MLGKQRIGRSQQLTLPDESAVEVWCYLELELAAHRLNNSEPLLRQLIAVVDGICCEAVESELALHFRPARTGTNRDQCPTPALPSVIDLQRGKISQRSSPATASQIRAIASVSARQRRNLSALLERRFRATNAGELTVAEAFDLLEDLKSSAGDMCLER